MLNATITLMLIGEIGPVLTCKRIFKHETSPWGDIPFYKVGMLGKQADAFISRELFERYKQAYPYPNKGEVLISAAGTVGRVVVFNGEDAYFQDSNILWVSNDETKVLNSYLYYCYQIQPWHASVGCVVPRLYKDDLRKAVIPVVPIPVQREIVRKLDMLSFRIESLKATFGAELTLRRRQHEYYADVLIRATAPVDQWKSVEEVIWSLKTGLNPRQNFKLNGCGCCYYITGKNISNHAITVNEQTDLITKETVALINRRASLATNDVLFVSTGTGTVGRMAVVEHYDHSWAVSEAVYCLKPKLDMVNPHFLMYALSSRCSIKQYAPRITKGAVPRLKIKDLLAVKIPVPSLSEQERILSVLQKLDTLYTGLEENISAEIKARQRQYELYRNMLLSFDQVLG